MVEHPDRDETSSVPTVTFAAIVCHEVLILVFNAWAGSGSARRNAREV
jgi:hypothetical protein